MGKQDSLVYRLARSEWFWLFMITGIAALLRFTMLGRWSLWGDEVSNIRDSLGVLELNIPRRSLSRIASRYVMLAGGTSEWHARFAPAVIGILTIPILYLPLRQAIGRFASLLTLLFLAISPWHLYWSQNARFYTAALLLYTLALLSFYFFLESNRLLYALAALVLLALAAQEHLTALILIPVVAAYILLLLVGPWPKPAGLNSRNLLLMVVPAVAVALFMAVPFLNNTRLMLGQFSVANNNPLWIIGGTVYYIGIPFVIAAAGGFAAGWARKNRTSLLFGLSAALPLAVMALISLTRYSANRYVFVTLISWLVLAAMAVEELARQLAPQRRWLAGLLTLILAASAMSENLFYYRNQNGNREDWRAALEWVADKRGPEDKIYVGDPRPANYYLPGETVGLANYKPPGPCELENTSWYILDMNIGAIAPETVSWVEREAALQAVFDVNFRARTFAMRVYKLTPPVDCLSNGT